MFLALAQERGVSIFTADDKFLIEVRKRGLLNTPSVER
jgi:hypothetical protein